MKYQKPLIKIHTVLAAFFLPVGIMYAVTGGLYTWGIKGNYESQEYLLELGHSVPADLSSLTALAEKELETRGISYPTGGARVRTVGTSYALEWSGSRRDVEISPTTDFGVAKLIIKETTPHRFFVQLHKAKVGEGFKVYAAIWAIGLLGLFLSGGLMAFFAKPYRKLAVVSAGLGFASFILMASTS